MAQRRGVPSAGLPLLARRLMLQASILTLLVERTAAKDEMKGEWGQEVLGCKCAGRKQKHGYCGYHFHWGSQEDNPWCRTAYNCGIPSSMKGTWMLCDERGVERRRGDDGKLYNSKQFKEFYGDKGKDKWSAGEANVERRLAKNGKPYTVFEFRDYYVDTLGEQGWGTEWASAGAEQRQANDGTLYNWEDFAKHYGESKAWGMWAAAKPAGKTDL